MHSSKDEFNPRPSEDYVPEEQQVLVEEPVQEPVTARNSSIRQLASPCVGKVVDLIDNRFPNATADHYTVGGAMVVLAGGALLLKNKDKPVLPTLLFAAGCLTDILDGHKARKDAEKHGTKPSASGMITDVTFDRLKDISIISILSAVSRIRGNDFEANTYALATTLAPVPSLMRSTAESRGLVVGEEALGSSVNRTVAEGIGMAFNDNRAVSKLVSMYLVAGCIKTSLERADVVQNGTSSKHCVGTIQDREFKEEGSLRKKRLVLLAELGRLAGTAALMYRPK